MGRYAANGFNQADRRLVRESMAAPILSREHEQELARAWRDHADEAALHALIKAYMRLVIAAASRFRHYGLPLADLIQEGVVGLLQAAGRFEPAREVRFSTYAGWWIRSSMQDFVLRNWSIVRTGTTAAQKSLFFNFRRLRARIDDGSNGGSGLIGDAARRRIAEELSVNLADVESMEMRLSGADQSLNAPVGLESDDSWQDFIADDRPDPEMVVSESMDMRSRARWLLQSLAELNEREQTIIRERRLRQDGRTLEELGVRLGISKERVRQIEHRALQKLKVSLLSHVRDPGDAALLLAVPL